MLTRLVQEYETFIRGTAFHLDSSPYLDRTVSIVFEYVPSHDNPQGPLLREWHLCDPHRALEKTTLLVAEATRRPDGPNLVINNVPFEAMRTISRSAGFFFADCPLSNLVYRLLADDLNRQYQMTLG